MTFALETPEARRGRARCSPISPFLRYPSERPQKGAQFVFNIRGNEHPAFRDDHFDDALGWSPGAFIKQRAAPLLVELNALWVRVPELDRDPSELADSIKGILEREGVPLPDLIVREGVRFAGLGELVCIWRIEPFRRPRKSAPAKNHSAFRRGLESWRNAVVKLSYALEPLGALPIHVVEALGTTTEILPFPVDPKEPLAQAAESLFSDPPRLIWKADVVVERRVVEVSKPLARFDVRLFNQLTAFGLAKRRASRRFLSSAVTEHALATLGVGSRHIAAVKIACACVWDGLDYDDTLKVLRAWQERTVNDGRFPERRGTVDEVELIARWASTTLSAGGPDVVRGAKKVPKNTKLELVKRLVLRFLASVDVDVWTGTLKQLRTDALLGEVEAGRAAAKCPLTTLKRALAELKAAGAVAQDVDRVGRTYQSRFTLLPAGRALLDASQAPASTAPPEPSTAPPPLSTAELAAALSSSPTPSGQLTVGEQAVQAVKRLSQAQSGQSTWGPRRLPEELDMRGGVQGSGSSLLGGGPGEGKPDSEPSPPSSPSPSPASADVEGRSASADSPETELWRRPRQRELALDGRRLEPRRLRRRRAPQMPPLEELLPLVDATLGATLSEKGRRELVARAYEGLRPRPRVLRDVVGALEQRARRLLTRHRWDFETAARPSPTSTPPLPAPPHDLRDPDLAITDFRHMLALAGKPLHERPVADRAKRLHDEGLSLVPLWPKSKKPAVLEWQPAQHKRFDLDVVNKRLAQLGEHAGLAVVCGAVSGVVVVDLDDASAVEWAKVHLPETPWRTRTGRAEGGEHWYYRAPSNLELPETLPFKGSVQADGRYVVAPGSIHPDTGAVYVALGDWGRPREELPRLESRWLVGVDELRAMRERILRE